MKQVRTLYVPIYRQYGGGHVSGGAVVHTATIRSDWTDQDYRNLESEFPGCCAKSARITMPLWCLGSKGHNADFNSLKRYSSGC